MKAFIVVFGNLIFFFSQEEIVNLLFDVIQRVEFDWFFEVESVGLAETVLE